MISRRFKVALASGGIVGLAFGAGFGPLVRHEIAQAGERFGAAVAVETVTPTAHGLRLEGVEVTVAEVPSGKARFDAVDVDYSLEGRHVTLRGGTIAAVGPRDVVLRQIEAWRANHLKSAGGPATASGSSTELAGLRVRWQDAASTPHESVNAADLRVVREGSGVTIAAGTAAVSLGRATFSIKDGRLALARKEGGYRVAGLTAAGFDATIEVPASKAAPAAEKLADHDEPPAIEAAPSRKRRGSKVASVRAVKAEAAPAPVRPVEPIEAPWMEYRAALLKAANAVDAVLDPSAKVRLEGVRARIRRGDDVLNLGPGVLKVARTDGQLVVDLAPELRAAGAKNQDGASDPKPPGAAPSGAGPAGEREEALTFRLAVPLGAGDGEVAADVNGGPIWLSTLGVREGDMGLFDVGLASLSTRSHLALAGDGKTLRIDGEAKVHALSLKSEALSDEPVAGLELAVRLKGELDLDGSGARVEDGEVDLGAIRVVAQGEYRRSGDAHRVVGTFDVPLTACQAMLDSTPKGLVPKLQGMRLAGSYALRGRADIDTARLDQAFVLDWDASNTCRVVEAPAGVSVERFRAPFRRTAYDPEGRPITLESGPGSPDWVPLTLISKFMETAVLTTEDGGFHHHHGFDHEAIRNSIRENLRRRKFVRGASTISMQLAKNLYLDRGKNLSRKLQEAVLTMYLEQELTKEQILELYFNVAEFGPMIYGIGPAAKSYFSATAHELSLGQALYISSILPNPKAQHFGAGGAVAPAWMSYLHKLMKIARDRDRITDEELDEGLRETVIRGSPSPQRSARVPSEGETQPELPAD